MSQFGNPGIYNEKTQSLSIETLKSQARNLKSLFIDARDDYKALIEHFKYDAKTAKMLMPRKLKETDKKRRALEKVFGKVDAMTVALFSVVDKYDYEGYSKSQIFDAALPKELQEKSVAPCQLFIVVMTLTYGELSDTYVKQFDEWLKKAEKWKTSGKILRVNLDLIEENLKKFDDLQIRSVF